MYSINSSLSSNTATSGFLQGSIKKVNQLRGQILPNCSWSHLSKGWSKLNLDACALGKPKATGIRGLTSDSQEWIPKLLVQKGIKTLQKQSCWLCSLGCERCLSSITSAKKSLYGVYHHTYLH